MMDAKLMVLEHLNFSRRALMRNRNAPTPCPKFGRLEVRPTGMSRDTGKWGVD